MIRVGENAILLRGDGLLTSGTMDQNGLVALGKLQPFKSRCWTAPTLVGDTIYLRSDAEIAALKLTALQGK